jgi:hypothetical protein
LAAHVETARHFKIWNFATFVFGAKNGPPHIEIARWRACPWQVPAGFNAAFPYSRAQATGDQPLLADYVLITLGMLVPRLIVVRVQIEFLHRLLRADSHWPAQPASLFAGHAAETLRHVGPYLDVMRGRLPAKA